MKVRDNGMPDETQWNDFFNVDFLLSVLNIDFQINDLVEIGSGYGTFTLPTAKLISGKLFAFDIEDQMIETLNQKIGKEQIDKQPFIIQPYHFGLINSKN